MEIALIVCVTIIILAWLITRTIDKATKVKWDVISEKLDSLFDLL